MKNYKKILKNLEEKYLSENKEIFYSKLSEILREILEQNKNKNISKMTFKEINKALSQSLPGGREEATNLISLIKNIYFKEYAQNIEDSEDIRKKLIQEVEKIIK
ncbi:MAG: hypothetical protein Q9M94_05735 [Candidatus Gracilibacteria bacterium]|nr:hypothetical protein [Candidatus Gracilibacteria bacterium]MDQ7022059.1 hypothetical protein [Candidatus Gracilibacteria bacterium]